jgi:hypothetical protein
MKFLWDATINGPLILGCVLLAAAAVETICGVVSEIRAGKGKDDED